ncbi:MAG: hypothetical protein WD401_03770 [Thermomicrobiaceae bacterium]
MLAPANWLFVGVAILLIGVLTYYLTLTTRPEISQISPAPNSSEIPGVVELEAMVTSQRDIEDAELLIDGDSVTPMLEEQGDNQWRVSHEQVFERGEREVVLKVTDSSGRTAEHSWSFEAAGDLIDPRLALMSPPSDVQVGPGLNGVVVQSTTFSDIDEVEITFNGEPVTAHIEEIEDGTEYSDNSDVPIYDWEIRAESWLSTGDISVTARVTDIHGAMTESEWEIEVAADEDSVGARYFDDSGEYAIEPFLTFWRENDGETTVGDPVGPPISESDGEVHQYFRYARLELDTEGVVHRGLIGRELFGEPETPPDRPPGENARLFDPTGHYVQGTIRDFWEEHGGLSAFGYPLSQEFETEEGYSQYFERALIDVIVLGNQEIIELAPLGEQLYEDRLQEQSEADQGGDSDEGDSS